MRWFYRAIGGGAWPVMRSHVSWCTKAMRVSLLRQKQYYVVWDDGEPKCEIMVASSVWEGATLCVPPAVLLVGAWHVDPVAICPTCRREEVHNSWKRASTEEYKTRLGFLLLHAIHRYKPGLKKGEGGSFPTQQAGEFGIVCSRQWGRKGNKQIKVERLSFGKI